MTSLLVLAKPHPDGGYVRGAQLNLLLRSVARFWPEARVRIIDAPAGPGFDQQLHHALENADWTVAFATDDSCFYRRVSDFAPALLDQEPELLCFSFRLGANTIRCGPTGQPQEPPGWSWRWDGAPGDFGYPGSVDATVFRRDDLRELLADLHLPNPTALEATLNDACVQRMRHRPLMASTLRSCYVSIPVNRVSDQSGVVYGHTYPQPAEELAERWDRGEWINLDAIFTDQVIDSCHVELEYQWARVEARV